MGDALTSFFVNNIILSIIILALILGAFRSGSGFLRRGLFILALIVGVLVLVPACGQYVSDQWHGWNRSVWEKLPGIFPSGACKVFGISDACAIAEAGNTAEASSDRQMQCIEDVIADPRNVSNGSMAAKQACGLRYDADTWAQCIAREFDKVPALQGTLLSCAAYGPSQTGSFIRDLIRPIACAFGMDSCTVAPNKDDYVYHKDYLLCLQQAVSNEALVANACATLQDPRAWDACMVGVINANPDTTRAKAWIDYCQSIRARPSRP